MKKRNYFILIFVLLLPGACFSQKKIVTVEEQKNINLFNEFRNFLVGSIRQKENIRDTSHLKYILLNYVFANKHLDSAHLSTLNNNELTADQLKNLKNELYSLNTFLLEKEKKHLDQYLTVTPIRLSTDSSVYNKLTQFQKENTFILCDERFPDKILGYFLFIPAIKNINSNARIWSWTLMFRFGMYVFKSVTGEEGHEYIFTPKNKL